ncbi:DNA-binding response regulator, OmpR family, contains REC and winged-helix (wHTH) domain [Seinonella peptonophila]|uniref:DNA-binding response regulator, OmpR family, contains REC and winged-helix (WHTH) domain n=1 Tax=Seinonella peptonophila TaxID=112248 RepID=A0A1M4VG99_9BACL|nr:response regulator transcription factor [Seinonella peptonophila]SHE68009.1 DNA-binding response regulator, OmpR family, contains REC and winged-helix (wHTH) domain [Seinonella peptonophila]
MNPTILIVDDEPSVLQTLQTFLQKEGFHIITASTGKEALKKANQFQPKIVILDWMLPEMSGIEVCQVLRQRGTYGIIMVTAKKEEIDRIIGLEVGADDYLTKPFSYRELAARIRALLRRMKDSIQISPTIHYQDLVIDQKKYLVTKKKQMIELTPTEFKILYTLASYPGIVFSRMQLLEHAIGDSFYFDERTIDGHISKLRKKIEDNPANPKYIQTVFGFGYRFGDPT